MSGKNSSIDQIWCRVLGRTRPAWPARATDFNQNTLWFHPNTLWFSSKYTLATVASLAGSRTPPPVPGPQQGTAWRSILAATPSTAAISTPFLNGNSANPLLYSSNEERSTSTARSHGPRKNHPQHPPDQKFWFFHFCKNIRVVYDFPGFVSRFCISGWFSARAPL